jgi:hypothetical protein
MWASASCARQKVRHAGLHRWHWRCTGLIGRYATIYRVQTVSVIVAERATAERKDDIAALWENVERRGQREADRAARPTRRQCRLRRRATRPTETIDRLHIGCLRARSVTPDRSPLTGTCTRSVAKVEVPSTARLKCTYPSGGETPALRRQALRSQAGGSQPQTELTQHGFGAHRIDTRFVEPFRTRASPFSEAFGVLTLLCYPFDGRGIRSFRG